jgi:threonine/homoserine/homoserine lactone efflux protein
MNFPYEVGVGLLLGFSLTVPPGPMNAFIASQSVRSLRRGVVTGLGAMSSDAILASVVFGLSTLVDLGSFVRAVYLLGCGVMGYLGYRLLAPHPLPVAAGPGAVRTYTTALAVGLSNPFQILWWLTAGLAFAYLGGLAVFVGLFGAIAIWIVVFPFALSVGVRRQPSLERWVTYASGAILIGFAVYFAWLAAL